MTNATVELFECPKCRRIDEPIVSYRWSDAECPGHSFAGGEHFHLTCRRCDYRTAIAAPVPVTVILPPVPQ